MLICFGSLRQTICEARFWQSYIHELVPTSTHTAASFFTDKQVAENCLGKAALEGKIKMHSYKKLNMKTSCMWKLLEKILLDRWWTIVGKIILTFITEIHFWEKMKYSKLSRCHLHLWNVLCMPAIRTLEWLKWPSTKTCFQLVKHWTRGPLSFVKGTAAAKYQTIIKTPVPCESSNNMKPTSTSNVLNKMIIYKVDHL